MFVPKIILKLFKMFVAKRFVAKRFVAKIILNYLKCLLQKLF
jgi:flagellar biosynthesis protein FliQ